MELRCSRVVGTRSSITLQAFVYLRQIKENQEKNQIRMNKNVYSLTSTPSHPSGITSLKHTLESSRNSHSQHHILGSGSRYQSRSAKETESETVFIFFHSTATFTELQPVKPVLRSTHLPALGSWSNSLCSHAISRAWDIFSRSKFGGNSDLRV